jgi:N-acetylneuraminic acid mutarotase
MRTILGPLLFLLLASALPVPPLSAVPADAPAPLTLAARVEAQEAVLRVMTSHESASAGERSARVPGESVPQRAAILRLAQRTLAESRALETVWNTPITKAMLDAEIHRMVRNSLMPARLRERFAALGDDRLLVREILARPVLADRLARSFFSRDRRVHAAAWSAAEDLRRQITGGQIDPRVARAGRTEEEIEPAAPRDNRTAGLRSEAPVMGMPGPIAEEADRLILDVPLEHRGERVLVARYAVGKKSWDDWWSENVSRFEVETIETPGQDMADGSVAFPGASAPDRARLDAGATCTPDTWSTLLGGAPNFLHDSRAVWTGSLMLVWGGTQAAASGLRYDPAIDTWSPMSTTGAPPLAASPSAVWTGSKMIVWGGSRPSLGPVNTGGAYDPVADAWTLTSTDGAPAARYGHTAIWTGGAMIVWGGVAAPGMVQTSTGGVYDPNLDQWAATAALGAPSGRSDHTAVWTGARMIVWGGCNSGAGCQNDGASYDPNGSGTWTPLPAINRPEARGRHTAVWTGNQMIVWGGSNTSGAKLNTGGRYDVVAGWSATTLTNAPGGRQDHTAIWNGAIMIVWGGLGTSGNALNDGGRYDPVADAWSATTLVNAPPNRFAHVAVWTGDRMVVWGSGSFDVARNDGGRFDPVANSWTPTSMGSQPDIGWLPFAFWTGNEVLVWGDRESQSAFSHSGGRYDPATDSWSVVTTPSGLAHNGVSAVWTGSRMIVWGGSNTTCCCSRVSYEVYTSAGVAYDPLTDTWAGIGSGGSYTPTARGAHTAVWTGKEMIIWGGSWQLPCGPIFYPEGARYDPQTDAWQPISSLGAPALGNNSAFTDGELTDQGALFWNGFMGGYFYQPASDTWTHTNPYGAPSSAVGTAYAGRQFVALDSLGASRRYDAVADSWLPVAANGPYPRCDGVVASSGTQVFWWGGELVTGQVCNTPTATGARYDPVADLWLPISTIDAPPGAQLGSAVWNGQQVIWFDRFSRLGYAYCMPGAGPCYRDLDGDGYGDPGASAQCNEPGVVWNSLDCDDSNPGRGGLAGEVPALAFGNAADLAWSAPSSPPGATFFYDVLRSDQPGSFSGAACIATDITDRTLSDPAAPPPGAATYYLVRASTCPGGTLEGSLGNGTTGTPGRLGPACP